MKSNCLRNESNWILFFPPEILLAEILCVSTAEQYSFLTLAASDLDLVLIVIPCKHSLCPFSLWAAARWSASAACCSLCIFHKSPARATSPSKIRPMCLTKRGAVPRHQCYRKHSNLPNCIPSLPICILVGSHYPYCPRWDAALACCVW